MNEELKKLKGLSVVSIGAEKFNHVHICFHDYSTLDLKGESMLYIDTGWEEASENPDKRRASYIHKIEQEKDSVKLKMHDGYFFEFKSNNIKADVTFSGKGTTFCIIDEK